MKHHLFLYFLSDTKATMEQRSLFGVHFFTILQHLLEIFMDGLPNRETRENLSAYGI